LGQQRLELLFDRELVASVIAVVRVTNGAAAIEDDGRRHHGDG